MWAKHIAGRGCLPGQPPRGLVNADCVEHGDWPLGHIPRVLVKPLE